MLGLGSSLAKGGASLLTYVKDNLKLYLNFTSNKSDTLKFPCEGSTSFDGTDDYINFGDLNISIPFSFALWIKPDVLEESPIFGIGSIWGSHEMTLYQEGTGGALRWRMNTGGSGGAGTSVAYTSSKLTAGKWTHIACVADGTNANMYVDGVEVSSGAFSGTLYNSGEDNILGHQPNLGSIYFDGSMCNFGLWSRGLSAEEVSSVMRKNYSQLGSVEKTSLVMWQSLDSRSTTGGAKEVVTPSSGEVLGNELVDNLNGTDSGWDAMSGNALSVNTYDHGTYVVCVYNQSEGDNVNAMRFYLGSSGTGSALSENVEVGALYKISMTGYIGGTTTSYPLSSDSGVRAEGSSWGQNAENVSTKTFYYKPTNASGNIIYPFYELGSYTTEGMAFIKDVSVKKVLSLTGQIEGATTTTSVYGSNAPVLPRSVDVAREGEAEAIGNGSASFTASNTDYIVSASNIDLDGGKSRTFSAWIRPDDNPSSGNIYDVLSYGAGTNGNYFEFGIYNDSGTVKAWANLHGEDTMVAQTFTAGEWYHYAVVYTAINTTTGTLKLYINGILVNTSGTLGSSNAINTTNDQLDIGRRNSGSGYFNGDIAQLGAWAGALTQAQIQSVMESTSYAKIPASVKSTLGSELLVSTGWTTNDGWGLSDGTLTFNDTGNGGTILSASDMTNSGLATGTTYKLQYTIGALSSGTADIRINDSDGNVIIDTKNLTNGSYTEYFSATSTNNGLGFRFTGLSSSGSSWTITDYSLKEVTNDLVGYWGLDSTSLGDELITNGTMEADSNWANYNTPDVNERSSEQAHSGTYSRKVDTNANYEGISSDAFTTITGAKYQVSFWVYPTDVNSIRIRMEEGDGSGNNINPYFTSLNLNAWNECTTTYTEASGGSSAQIHIESGANSGADDTIYYIDDVSIKEIVVADSTDNNNYGSLL